MAMRPFALSALALAALVGCGVPPPPVTVAEAPPAKTAKPTGEPVTPPKQTPDATKPGDGKVTPPPVAEDPAKQGLKFTDTKVGTGDAAAPGDTCYVLYTGKLTNGTVFDASSKHENKPLSFAIGAGQVIRGWELGVQGMKAGGKRTLNIPAKLGYAEKGSGDTIPPNSDLIFDIELLAILKADQANTVSRTVITPGTGRPAKAGDVVNITYKGTLIDGTEFDSTQKQGGKPLQFTLGKNMVIPGFDLAITGMKKGEKIKAVIPPQLGYGYMEKGAIPANSILNFEITLVSIG